LPLVISDHADWDGLLQPSARTGAVKSGSRMAKKTRWCIGARRKAWPRARSIWSVYGDEDSGDGDLPASEGGEV